MDFTRQAEGLSWGVFTFHGPGSEANGAFDVVLQSDGTDFGDATAVLEAVRAAQGLGDVVTIAGWESRTFPLVVTLAAADGEELAVAEREMERQASALVPPPLVWTPPLGLSAPVAFDVQVVEKRRVYEAGERWDVEEAFRGERTFELTFTCRPFVRAVEKVVIPALAPPVADPTVTDVNACDTTAGWTVSGDFPALSTGSVVTPAEDPDSYLQVQTSQPALGPGDRVELRWDGSVPIGGAGWVIVRLQRPTAPEVELTVRINGHATEPDARDAWHVWYPVPVGATTLQSIVFKVEHNGPWHPVTASNARLRVFNLALTDSLPLNGTGRQLSRLSEVRGGRETEATVRLWDETSATLGRAVLVHTSRNLDWTTSLRDWEVEGSDVLVDATKVSGGWSYLQTPDPPFVARIPAEVFTAGMYALMAHVATPNSPGATLRWSVSVVDAAGVEAPWTATQSGEVFLELVLVEGSPWRVVAIADDLHLPPSLTAGGGWFVEVTLAAAPGADVLALDEAWLFGLDDGCLTWWEDSSGSAEWLEVRSPDLGGLYPSIWAGVDVEDFSTGMEVSRLAKSAQPHRFRPGPIRVTTVCLGSTSSRCELEYYPRGDHHIVGADLQPPEEA